MWTCFNTDDSCTSPDTITEFTSAGEGEHGKLLNFSNADINPSCSTESDIDDIPILMPDMTEENTPEESSELLFFSSAKDHVRSIARSSVLQSRPPERWM